MNEENSHHKISRFDIIKNSKIIYGADFFVSILFIVSFYMLYRNYSALKYSTIVHNKSAVLYFALLHSFIFVLILFSIAWMYIRLMFLLTRKFFLPEKVSKIIIYPLIIIIIVLVVKMVEYQPI